MPTTYTLDAPKPPGKTGQQAFNLGDPIILPYTPQMIRNELQDALERFRELARSIPSELGPVAIDLECRLMEIRNRIR
jgi:hypothetical protein